MPAGNRELQDEFIERLSLHCQRDGLPPASGRIFARLVFDPEPISFGALADELKISRGSVSMATRQLEERGMLRRCVRPGDRQYQFSLAEGAFDRLLDSLIQRGSDTRSDIERIVGRLSPEDREARPNLDAYLRFQTILVEALVKAREEFSAQGSSDV